MADLSVTGEVVVTSEKAEAAFDRVGDKATQMANEVASSAGKAGQAVDGIGAGAEKSADKFTRAESRMRDAIKRSTQELQLLGKTASEKLEFNIQAKGLDAAKFAPYIEELKKAEAAQRIATGSLDKMGVSAAQTAAALRGVPAQFTDIITSLQGGQAPLTVFLQQGGQLRDMFGGAGTAARALGGYVAGLINPFTLAAVAVGGLGLAYAAGSKEADGYRQALVLTGNQAGSTVGQMQQMAQQIAGVTGSQREAAAALAEFASSGKVGQENLRQFTQTAIEFSRVTGQSVDAVAKNFADLAKDPLKATLKLNESMNYLTESIFRQIQSLQDQGRETEAANVAQKAYADTLDERKGEIVRNLGTIEKAWAAIKKEANSAMDAFLDIGRLSTLETRLQRAQSALQSYQGTLPGRRTTAQVAAVQEFGGEEGLEREIAGLQDLIENQRKSAEMERERAAAVKASTDLATDALKYESDLDKQRRAVLSATEKYQTALAKGNLTAEQRNQLEADYLKLVSGITAVKEKKGGRGGLAAENKGLRDQQRIFAELADVSSTYYADLEKAQQQRAKGNLSEAQYVKYVEELIQKQPFAVAQEKARAEAIKESAKAASESSKALSAWYDAREKESQGFASQINARREEVTIMGMTTEAVVAYTQAKYEQQAAEKEAYAAALESASFYAGEYAEAYNIAAEAARQQAAQLRELGGLEVEKANKDAAKKAAQEWERAAADIERALTDSLLRGFESGKDFAQNLRDSLKNMFSTLVLRPIISAAMSPVAGAINGMLYGNAAAAAGGGANALGMLGSGANLINGLQGTQGMLGTVGGWLGLNTVAANTGLAATIGIDAASAAAAANGAAAAGSSGLMGTIGAAMPWIAGAAAIMSIVSSFDDSGTYHTGGAAQYSAARGLSAGQSGADYNIGFGRVEAGAQTISAVGSIAQALGTALDGVAVAFGQTAGYEIATAFADDTSEDGAWGALRISKDGQELLNWQDTRTSRWAPKEFGDGEGGYKEYLAAVAKDTRQVLLDMDLPSWADKMLESIGESASMEQLSGVLAQIGVVQTAFVSLGNSMAMFANLTDEMQSGLLAAAGSIEAITAGAGAFYQGFYSEQERMDSAVAQINKALTGLDLSIDPTLGDDAKDQFRAAVEGAFAAGDAELAAALLSLSGNFANAADYFEQAAEAQAQAAKEAADVQIKAAQDAARAIAEAYESAMGRIGSARFDLENQLLTQSGQGQYAQQLTDQRDLAELTKGLPEDQAAKVREQFEANLKLRDQYEANQLAADNLAKAMEEMERQQNAAAQAQRSMLQSTVQSAQNAVSQLKSIFDMLDSSISSLRGSVTSAAEQDSRAAREYIAQASVLMRSGSVVDAGRLQAAVRSATAGIDNQSFANSNEADFERLKLAGELAGLKDSTAGQLTVAEQHLSIAESQLAALEYIASSISSLAGAQQAAAGQPRDQWTTVSGQQVYASSGGAVGVNTGSGIDIYGKDGSLFTGAEAIAFVRNQVAVNDEASVYAEAVRTGISAKALDELMGWADGTSNDWAKANKLPQFAIGTNYVPRDMVAQIHEGEAIVPKAFNPWAGGSMGSDNTALIAELRALRAEVAELRNAAEETAGATGATADVLVRVTQNGNGMVTAAAPI